MGPPPDFDGPEKYRYLSGFNSYLESSSLPNAPPLGQNSPQHPPYGLYAEKLSGTAFTTPRHQNKQTWLYRVMPSCVHPPFQEVLSPQEGRSSLRETMGKGGIASSNKQLAPDNLKITPNQLRWSPFSLPPPAATPFSSRVDFITGFHPLAGAGTSAMKNGLSISIYCINASMPPNTAYSSCDGDLLLVPQLGTLHITTEMGSMLLRPCEIGILPRGVRYRVSLAAGEVARGYALEIYSGHFQLPELGPIGSSGLANERDFQVPIAHFTPPSQDEEDEKDKEPWKLFTKLNNTLHTTNVPNTPFDVAAWHGTYYPVKYSLHRFNVFGSVSYDHPDPSIFTVLTAPGTEGYGAPGTALADVVVFPPRWAVAEGTFRPPWFHRNIMAEFMGLIRGAYDAKARGGGGGGSAGTTGNNDEEETGFAPGGASLHNVMAAHGPDVQTVEKARGETELKPVKIGGEDGGMAFMFETSLMLGVTGWGMEGCNGAGKVLQDGYGEGSWGGMKRYWEGTKGEVVRSNLI